MYRDTYMEVYLKNIKYNVEKIINKYNDYKYYFGVVKASCYGLGLAPIKQIIEAGCNYLAVATLDEALEIREIYKDIDILCLGIIDLKYINICKQNNITITISNIDYLKELIKINPSIKAHLKLNTGMNRLGIKKKEEVTEIYNLLKDSNIELEGIFTHIYNSDNQLTTNKQFEIFEHLTSEIDLSTIKIIHIGASTTTINYPKKEYCNGCRLGIIMYGLEDNNTNDLLSCFSLKSKIIQINEIENETVGYNGAYSTQNKELIGVVPIGYADGFIRKNNNNKVYINNKEYNIVGNICMDMLFVKLDETVKVGDEVVLIKDNNHISSIAKNLDTITYEISCSIGKRIPRIYK